MIYLFILFTVIPVIELAILIKVGKTIGTINTIALLLVTGFVGAYMARVQGFLVLRTIQQRLEEGLMPTEEMLDGFLLLIGGILLLTPGFLTDVWGLCLIFPLTRSFLKLILRRRFNAMLNGRKITGFYRNSSFGKDSFTDIDI